MENEDQFQAIFSATLQGGDSMSLEFPVPKRLEPYVLSNENVKRAIEYYLLARYAYLHRMYTPFMINSFWTLEHLMLSILIFKYEKKEDLGKIGGYHEITRYWKEAKSILSPEMANNMSKFDDYVGKVKGYFTERYPAPVTKIKLTHTRKKPKIYNGDSKNKDFLNVGKVAPLRLDDLDHFTNFMLHDIVATRNEISSNLSDILMAHENTDLYKTQNNYSIVYPNKKYSGEML